MTTQDDTSNRSSNRVERLGLGNYQVHTQIEMYETFNAELKAEAERRHVTA